MVQLGIIKEDNIMSDNTNNGFPVPEEPLTREEQYLSAIAGVTEASEIPEKPLTRVEAYLNKIVENGGGGGSSFEPTDEQLAAMNSGATTAKIEQIETNKNNISTEQSKTAGMSAGGANYIVVNGIKIFVSTTEPTGAQTGDLWIGG